MMRRDLMSKSCAYCEPDPLPDSTPRMREGQVIAFGLIDLRPVSIDEPDSIVISCE